MLWHARSSGIPADRACEVASEQFFLAWPERVETACQPAAFGVDCVLRLIPATVLIVQCKKHVKVEALSGPGQRPEAKPQERESAREWGAQVAACVV